MVSLLISLQATGQLSALMFRSLDPAGTASILQNSSSQPLGLVLCRNRRALLILPSYLVIVGMAGQLMSMSRYQLRPSSICQPTTSIAPILLWVRLGRV
jgi:hypothetical protein